MAGSDFTVSMILRAVNQMSPAIQQAASQLRTLQNQINQVNSVSNKGNWFDKAISRTQLWSDKLETVQKSMDKIVRSGEKDLMTGGIMALPLVGMIKSAANVQRTQMSLELAGFTSGQVNQLTAQAQQTMRKTMFGTGDVLGIDLALSQVGMNYQKTQSVGKSATYLAELEANRNGADPQATAKQFAQMAEQLQISMDPAKVKQLADQVNRISTITSASVATLSDSSRYFNLVGTIQGLKPSDIMLTQGLAARYGLEGSIGGTNLKDFFERLNPTLHMNTMMGKPIVNAFASMGWLKGVKRDKKGNVAGITGDVFHDAKGNLVGAAQIFSVIAQSYQKMGNKEQFNGLMTRIFGQQGQAIAAAVAQNPQYFGMLQQQMGKVPTVNQSVTKFQGTTNQQFHAFISTLSDFGRQVGTMLLPSLTGYLKQLNANMPKIQTFIDKHKQLLKALAEVWAGLAAFKIASGVAKIAVAAPIREIAGAARFGLGALRGGLKGARAVSMAGRTYREFRQIGAGHGMAIEAAIQQGIGIKPTATIKATVNAMKTLGSATVSAASSFAKVSGQAAVATARFIANGAATIAVKTAQLTVAAASRTWAAVQWLVNAALTANPIGLIIVGIGVLIGAIVLMVTHWKTVVNWLKQAWTWYSNLGDKVKILIAIFVPFIGMPALIISKWGVISKFFQRMWKDISPMIQGLEHFFDLGGGSGGGGSPVLAARIGGGGNVQMTNHYYIQSTDPKQAANEVGRTQQKYIDSRYPIPAVR